MHRSTPDQGHRRLWLFAGTGEGPVLAEALLAAGWRVRVSVVTPDAGRAYGHLPDVELRTGALDGALQLQRELVRARRTGEPFTVVVDATHPFALRIRQALAEGCAALHQPLLRLQRPELTGPGGAAVTLLGNINDLSRQPLADQRILLAIGARQLGAAVAATPGAIHHARILPSALALQQAMAAGLAEQRVALLRPTAKGDVEEALLRQWGITRIVARQSGGPPERLWRRLALQRGYELVLLQRPAALPGEEALDQAALLARLMAWPG